MCLLLFFFGSMIPDCRSLTRLFIDSRQFGFGGLFLSRITAVFTGTARVYFEMGPACEWVVTVACTRAVISFQNQVYNISADRHLYLM
uniref:Putative secreted protein n=1 Tax=Ixodes scapularis TaxID=6945 RepID=A0A4D5REJ9_IXOSC